MFILLLVTIPILWLVLAFATAKICRRYFSQALRHTPGRRFVMRAVVVLLLSIFAATVLGSFLYVVKIFAAVATVAEADKSVLLAKGIAELMNEQPFLILRTLGVVALGWISLKLLNRRPASTDKTS